MPTLSQFYGSTRSIERLINSTLTTNKFIEDLKKSHAFARSSAIDFSTNIANISSISAVGSLGTESTLSLDKILGSSAASILSADKIANMTALGSMASRISSEAAAIKILGSQFKINELILPENTFKNSLIASYPSSLNEENSIFEEENEYVLLYWSKISLLSAHEATCLLLERNPENSSDQDFGYIMRRRLIERAQLNNELGKWIKPIELLIWAQGKELNFSEKYALCIKNEAIKSEGDFPKSANNNEIIKEDEPQLPTKAIQRPKKNKINKSKQASLEDIKEALMTLVCEQTDCKLKIQNMMADFYKNENISLVTGFNLERIYMLQIKLLLNELRSQRDSKSKRLFRSQNAIVSAIVKRFPNKDNLSKDNLVRKFAEVNQYAAVN